MTVSAWWNGFKQACDFLRLFSICSYLAKLKNEPQSIHWLPRAVDPGSKSWQELRSTIHGSWW